MKTRGQTWILTAAIAAGASPAFAVDEIVVTAQRREQSLQEVPVAVSAFDSNTIEQLQMNVVKDIGQNVPNLQTYTVTAGAQAIQVHSRGASVQNPGFNASESPVGIYQDDVYFGRLASANLDLADVERIEVLRGPQGTLYGRNTIAGAIKIISRTPGDEAWATGSAGIGNYDTWKLSGSVGGPIEEGALAGSLAVLYEDRGAGWQDNPLTGAEPGQYENLVMRGKLHWYQGDFFDAVVSVWGADLDNDGYNGVPYSAFPDSAGKDTGGPLGPTFYSNLSGDGVNYGSSDQTGASLDMSFKFGFATLRSITALSTIDDRFGFDLAGGGGIGIDTETANNGLLATSDSSVDTLSQELQLIGDAFDGSVDWILGAYYQGEDGEQTYAGTFTAPGPFTVFDFSEAIETDTDSYALFAQATWKMTDRLSLTAGARWTDDEKKYDNVCTGTTCSDDVDSTPAVADVHLDESFDEVTGKIGVDYKLTDDSLVYLSFSQGFQAGGFQTLCFGNMSATCAGTFYEPQTVDSIEAGWKSDFLDNTLRLNLVGFYAMYDDLQQTGLTGSSFPLQNIGDVDVYGAELEASWTPIDNLNVFGFLGWQESNLDAEDLNPLSSCALASCDELPSNPQFTGKLGFSYAMPVSEMVEFFYGADVYYSDEYYSTSENALLIDDYARLNAFIGIGEPDGRWQVTFAGRNVTDEEDNVSGIVVPSAGINIRTPLPPAEYMLTFKVNY